MKTLIVIIVAMMTTVTLAAQRYDLGDQLAPSQSDFEYLGTSSKTGVSTYRYKKPKTQDFFDRKIDEIIVGVRRGVIVSTVYTLIPEKTDVGVPKEILAKVQSVLPYPLAERNGIYGVNIDNESISIARVRNELTSQRDRILFVNSIKQSVLESTK